MKTDKYYYVQVVNEKSPQLWDQGPSTSVLAAFHTTPVACPHFQWVAALRWMGP